MITFFCENHVLHAPQWEMFRGERVACLENPSRAGFVRTELLARGHALRAPDEDSHSVLTKVHTPRYLGFLQTAWTDWLALDPGHA